VNNMNKKAQISLFFLIILLSLIVLFIQFIDIVKKTKNIDYTITKNYTNAKKDYLKSAINSLDNKITKNSVGLGGILESDKQTYDHYNSEG